MFIHDQIALWKQTCIELPRVFFCSEKKKELDNKIAEDQNAEKNLQQKLA